MEKFTENMYIDFKISFKPHKLFAFSVFCVTQFASNLLLKLMIHRISFQFSVHTQLNFFFSTILTKYKLSKFIKLKQQFAFVINIIKLADYCI